MASEANNNEKVTVPATLLRDSVQLIGAAGKFAQSQRDKQAAYKARIGPLVDRLVARELIAPTMRDKVASKIADDPVQLVEFMVRLADAVGPSSLGKSASGDVAPPARSNSRIPASANAAFERHYGS